MKVRRGSAAIFLVAIIMILIIVVTAAVAVAFTTAQDSTTHSRGDGGRIAAETGIENAVLRLLRDPSYAGESNLSVNSSTVTIQVTGTDPKTITATAVRGTAVRTIQATASVVNGKLTVTSWQEL